MQTLQHKTPMARKEALDYCRRCLAVMVCCVLVFSLTVRVTPRAKAVVVEGAAAAAVAASGGVPAGALPGAAAGLLAMIGVGVAVEDDAALSDENFYRRQISMRMGYKWGWQLDEYLSGLDTDSLSREEWLSLVDMAENGGLTPGKAISLSPDLASLIRTWVRDNMDFVAGSLSYSQGYIASDSGVFFLSHVDTSSLDSVSNSKYMWLPVQYVGSSAVPQVGNGSESESFSYFYGQYGFRTVITSGEPTSITPYYSARALLYFYGSGVSGSSSQVVDWSSSSPIVSEGGTLADAQAALVSSVRSRTTRAILFYSATTDRLYSGQYNSVDNQVYAYSRRYLDKASERIPFLGATTTLTETSALSQPVTKAVSITIPQNMTYVDVAGVAVPDIGSLTPDVLTGESEEEKPGVVTPPWDRVLEGLESIDTKVGSLSGSIADAVSTSMADALADTMSGVISRAEAQQVTVSDAMTEPDSLGAVFISKFPFSIPWDVVKAIKLLAAPPVTPHWEVDFMQPIAGRVGGFQGSTTIVIDFGDYPIVGIATRWFSTLMFVYALASGTKKLIWTA